MSARLNRMSRRRYKIAQSRRNAIWLRDDLTDFLMRMYLGQKIESVDLRAAILEWAEAKSKSYDAIMSVSLLNLKPIK